MKKLLFLLTFPIIGFSQGGYYNDNKNDISKICDFYRGNSFASNASADNALDRILNVTGMSKRFVLYPCSNIENCIATSYKGIRYILYDKDFMEEVANNTSSWSKTSILAHEVGHHVNGHSIDLLSFESGKIDAPSLKESRQMEIEADEYSGFVMQKLGASLSQAQEAVKKYSSEGDDSFSTHPNKVKRLAAISKGYELALKNSSIKKEPVEGLITKYEDYFYDGYSKYNLKDYYGAIADYSKAIEVYANKDKPNLLGFAPYFFRGLSKHKLKDFEGAIKDYNIAIKLNPKQSDVYFNRAYLKNEIKDYYGAIADYTKAIEFRPGYASAYSNLGFSKYNLKDYYGAIADYTKALEFNPNDSRSYLNRGLSKKDLKDYNGAVSDFTKAIELSPNYAEAYFQRAFSKLLLGQSTCEDVKKACDLGKENACSLICK